VTTTRSTPHSSRDAASERDGTELSWLGTRVARFLLRRMVGPRRAGGTREIRLAKFGIDVADADCRARITGVLRAFFGGFETGLLSPADVRTTNDLATAVDTLAPAEHCERLFAPFWHEGAAMAAGARDLLRLRSRARTLARFGAEIAAVGDPFRFLRYVGLGFWLGFRHGTRARCVDAAAAALAERGLRHLVHDGYGFQVGFFTLRKRPRVVESLRRFEGFARESAFNGVGRSLWFFYMDRPDVGLLRARSFEGDALAVIGGMGLAAAFTRIDQLAIAYAVADELQRAERAAFEKGIRIALYCRHANDRRLLDRCVDDLPPALATRARADLAHAVAVGDATSASDEFIAEFHAGCAVAPS